MAPGSTVDAEELTSLEAEIRAAEPEFLANLERLVNTDCGSYTPAGVDEIGRFVAGFLESAGAAVETRPDPAGRLGATVVGTWAGDRATAGGPRLLLIG